MPPDVGARGEQVRATYPRALPARETSGELEEEGHKDDLPDYDRLVAIERERLRLHDWALLASSTQHGAWHKWSDLKLLIKGSMLRLVIRDKVVWATLFIYCVFRVGIIFEKNFRDETEEPFLIRVEQRDVSAVGVLLSFFLT